MLDTAASFLRATRAVYALGAVAVIGAFLHASPGSQSATKKPDEAERAVESASTVKFQLPIVARPEAEQPAVGHPADTHLDKTPPRKTRGLDLVKIGWTYNCMECHRFFPAKWHYDRPMVEHQDVKLQHGENRFCLNCHHPQNRNAFVDYDGSEIAQADVVLLCAKCHGPTHRDWKAGVHGRQNGFWKPDAGARTKLRCIQCHDPHKPKFQAMKPLPPLRYPPRAANPPPQGGVSGQRH
jgi:hypothetical protein